MKSFKAYIPSIIAAFVLVFALLGASALVTAESIVKKPAFSKIIETENVVEKTQSQLEVYFSDKYNETGIPAEIYTEALSDEYISSVINMYVDAAFSKLSGGEFSDTVPANEQLESEIESFFSDYADSIDYDKDDKYYEKLDSAIDSAYKAIGTYCDVYKLSAINNQGILGKAQGVYRNLPTLLFAAAAAVIVLVALLIIINRRSMRAALYWSGISALISGILGLIPAIYISATNYFDSFVVKQPQVFSAFTGIMYKSVDTFALYQGVIAGAGALLIIIYAVICKANKDT